MIGRGGAIALVLLLTMVPAGAAKRTAPRVAPAALVDGSMLAASGAAPMARELERRISSYLTGQGLPAGTVLRLKSLSMNGSPSGGDDTGPGALSDYLDCELVVSGVARPLLIAAPADAAGPDYLPGHEMRRLDSLARFTAQWVVKTALAR